MTAEYKNPKEAEKVSLENILHTVKSIDSCVEDILDTMKDHFEVEQYDPDWDHYENPDDLSY